MSDSSPQRRAQVRRSTRETAIEVELWLDQGQAPAVLAEPSVRTGAPFLDHLLAATARHGRMGLSVRAAGDLDLGFHHTVEDTGLALGEAIRAALYGGGGAGAGSAASGVSRFGHAAVPMDEALVLTAVDFSGRPYCALVGLHAAPHAEGFAPALWTAFCRGLTSAGMFTLHQQVLAGEDGHHILEAAAKSLGLALLNAWQPVGGRSGGASGSTKGTVRMEVKT